MKENACLEQQISEAKKLYPTLITRSQNSYSIIFQDIPQNQFEIFIKQEFPETAPLVHMNREKVQISLLTFWHPDFTLIQLFEQLHLYSAASIKKYSFSPPMTYLPSPTVYESKIKQNNTSKKYYGRLISFSKDASSDIFIEEEEEEPEDIIDTKTYQKQLNELNLKLKKKQIHISEYMTEHQTLKKAVQNNHI